MSDPAHGYGLSTQQGYKLDIFHPNHSTLPAQVNAQRTEQPANRKSQSNMQPVQLGDRWSTSEIPSQPQYPEPANVEQAAAYNVEMPSIYSETPVDDQHAKWLGYFRYQLEAMKTNLNQWEATLKQFESSPLSNRTGTIEYKAQLIETVAELEKLDYCNQMALSEMKAYLESLPVTGSIWSEAPSAAVCARCQSAKPQSSLSCPSHHVLCLDCAGEKYMARDLKCVCECPWSQEQCRSLHEALITMHPEWQTSMPKSPLLPLGEVKCECCQKSVGTAAIDPYICAQTHQICKSCAKRRGPRCPLCS